MKPQLSNIDVALLALYDLGGAQKAIHAEDVALRCWKLVPERFSWKKYREFPDVEPARFALEDAAKPRYGELARLVLRKIAGKPQAHWMLTAAGVEYVHAHMEQFQALMAAPARIAAHHTESDQLVFSLEKHAAFKKYAATGTCDSVEPYEFTDMLRCSLDASPKVLRGRLESLKARLAAARKPKVIDFLEACEFRFRDMLENI